MEGMDDLGWTMDDLNTIITLQPTHLTMAQGSGESVPRAEEYIQTASQCYGECTYFYLL